MNNNMKPNNDNQLDAQTISWMKQAFISWYDWDSTPEQKQFFEKQRIEKIKNTYKELSQNILVEEQTFSIAIENNENIQKAFSDAEIFYGGLKRKISWKPYVKHPISVAKIISCVTQDEKTIIWWLFHDVIEDVEKGEEKMIKKWYNDDIINLVKLASEKDKSLSWEERKKWYIENIKNLEPTSLIISLWDKIANLRDMIYHLEKDWIWIFDHFNAWKEAKEDILFKYSIAIHESMKKIEDINMKNKVEKLYDELIWLMAYFSLLIEEKSL